MSPARKKEPGRPQARRRTQAERRAETRTAVLESACRHFGAKGFADTSLESTEVTSELDPDSARFQSIVMLVPHFSV